MEGIFHSQTVSGETGPNLSLAPHPPTAQKQAPIDGFSCPPSTPLHWSCGSESISSPRAAQTAHVWLIRVFQHLATVTGLCKNMRLETALGFCWNSQEQGSVFLRWWLSWWDTSLEPLGAVVSLHKGRTFPESEATIEKSRVERYMEFLECLDLAIPEAHAGQKNFLIFCKPVQGLGFCPSQCKILSNTARKILFHLRSSKT